MKKLLILAAFSFIPALFGTGCASDRDKVVRDLELANEEKASLQMENERLNDQVGMLKKENQRLQNALVEANNKPAPKVDEEALLAKLREYWNGNGDWDVIQRGGAVGVRIDDRGVLFKSGSWELTDAAKATLGKLAALIEKKMNAQSFVRVDGHTDSDPINKAKGAGILDNVHLSVMRAMAVRNFLISKGIAADRVFVAGFGEHWPVASNSNPKGKSQNRRVEVFLGTADGLSIGDMPSASKAPAKPSGTESASKAPAKPADTVSKK